jgi:ribonuclease HI
VTKYYVVWKGRQTGLFTSWDTCAKQVQGFPGAEYKAFENRAVAEAALKGRYADYTGQPAPPRLTPAQLARIGQPLPESYVVDASCLGNPGQLEYRCVHTHTRAPLFHQGPYAEGTNNIGEFLAIVHALMLLQQRGLASPLYSDSENALAWARARHCKTRLTQTSRNAELFGLIARAEEWLRANPYPNRLLKWETEAWGENPADYGRK